MTLSLHRRSLSRWICGGLIAFGSLIQAMRALGTPGRGASFGGLAIAALAILTVVGMVGLLRARLRIERELRAMEAQPAGGSLVSARRARLAHIAAVGARPDTAALAEEAAAAERGQAYLGRYLVAVAVLIGLVGTFSGLAEALRALPSIFNGAAADPQRLAELMSASMAGLDLTFAAGTIGILATLALALVQGDLQVHEARALARLEEETAHELIPALWPQAERAEERMVRELTSLRQEASTMRALVAETGTTLGAAVAAELSVGMKELFRQQAESARALDRQAEAAQRALAATAEQQAAAAAERWRSLHEEIVETAAQLSAQLAAVHREIGAQAEATQHALTLAATRQADTAHEGWRSVADTIVPALDGARTALDAGVLAAVSTLDATAGQAAQRLGEATQTFTATAGAELSATREALTAAADRSAAAITSAAHHTAEAISTATDRSAAAMTEAVDRSHAAIGDVLDRARASTIDAFAGPSAQLADAATALAQSQRELAPQLEALTPELRALTQEVALLGARPAREEEQPLFADELVRLGEGMSRLEALVQLAQQRGRKGAQG